MSKSSRRVVPVTTDPVSPGDGLGMEGERIRGEMTGRIHHLSARRSAEHDKLSISSEDSGQNFTTMLEPTVQQQHSNNMQQPGETTQPHSSGRMNISGQSDLDGSSERGSEERTGSSRVAPPAANETLTANNSSGNLFELDHSSEHAYRREKGNGHSTDSSRLSVTMETPNNISNNNRGNNKSNAEGGSGKKKKGYWYNVLSPTYKSRSEDFKKLFKEIPNDERLIVDYSCAMQKDILVHGRLYVTQNWICFYANIFRWETVLTIKCSEIKAMTKERTARVIPNAIQICTSTDKYFFTSFGARDKTYLMLFRVWQNALMDQPMSTQELWQWVHYSYGDELGLTSSDDDYVPPNPEDEIQLLAKLKSEGADTEDGAEENGEGLLNGDVISANTYQDSASSVGSHQRSGSHHVLIPEVDSIACPNTNNSADDGIHNVTSASEIPASTTTSTRLHIVTPDATSGDLPTDLGDTSEDDAGVVTCSGHEHKKEHIYLDEVYHFNVDQLFEHLFTDSEFYRNFLNARKTFDLIQAPWPEDPDENGEKKREIGYTLSLNYSIGPKVSQSSEKQTILAQSKPGHLYVVETDCTQGGIPYGDNFYVQNRYCITRVSSTRARLVAQSEIKYKKNVWGLVKNLIEKNGIQGMRDNFKLLGDMLRAEAEKSSPQGAAAGRKKMLRKRRPHASVPDRSPSLKRSAEQRGHAAGSFQGQSAKGSFSEDDWHIKVTTDSLVYFVCAILLVLVLFNVLLFYKLWSLESKASSLHQFAHRHTELRHTDPIYAHPSSPPHHHHSPDEWNHVIEQQHRLHELELERWKDVLTASVSLVDQMKITLQELLANIEHRTQLLAEMVQQQKEASKH